MSVRRPGKILYGIAFVVLLADGVAAIWLGQMGGRAALVVVGACLVLGSLGLGVLYKRWQAALEEVDRARRSLREEVEALRRVVHDVAPGQGRQADARGGDGGGAGGARSSPRPGGKVRRA